MNSRVMTVQDVWHSSFIVENNENFLIILFVYDTADISVEFIMRDASSSATCLIVGLIEEGRSVMVKTAQIHKSPHTLSRVLVKTLVGAQATFTYNGLISIAQEATMSQATQQNKNILLDRSARATSCPQLEIATHEVSCSHGSATAQLDAEQFFYMGSRGIEGQRAKNLLFQGFFADILEAIDDSKVRKEVYETVAQRLSLITEKNSK